MSLSLRDRVKEIVNQLSATETQLIRELDDWWNDRGYVTVSTTRTQLQDALVWSPREEERCQKKLLWLIQRDHDWRYFIDSCGTRPGRKCSRCDQKEVWLDATQKWLNLDDISEVAT